MNQESVIAFLRAHPAFADLDAAQVKQLAGCLKEKSFHKGELIHLASRRHDMFLLQYGRVKVSRISPDGREQVLCIADADQCAGACGFFAFFGVEMNGVIAEALDEAILYTISQEDLVVLAEKDPQIGAIVLRLLTGCVRQLSTLAARLSFQSVPERLAAALLEYADRWGVVTGEGMLVECALTQEQLAAIVGTSRPVAARALAKMREQGMIHTRRGQIVILNRAALEALADAGL